MTLQHGQQQRQAILIHALRQTFRITAVALGDQRLNFDEQRTAALPGNRYNAAGSRHGIARQENRRWIAHFAKPRFRHRKHTHFTRSAKPVFHRANQRVSTRRIILEIEDCVDHVFDHPRPGNRAFLGDMTDQENGHIVLFCELHDAPNAFTHLRN